MASTITTSITTGGTNNHATTSAEANAVGTDFFSQGVVGSITNTAGVAPNTGAFAVNAQGTPAMFVDVTAGSAWITATPSGQTSQLLRAYMASAYTSYAISSNSSGSTKYDWIYLSVDATKANNPASDASDVTSLYTSRSSSNTTDNGTPPTYGILLAVVTVANGASSITNGNIADARSQALPASSSLGWTFASNAWTYSSYDSTNKTGVITVTSDATLRYSAGMRVRFYNNGSLQYGIITKVTSTTITVYFGTDYSLTNSAITQPAYSYQKAPFGFPLDPTKWTVTYDYSDDNNITSATAVQVASHQISLPIGSWSLRMTCSLRILLGGNNTTQLECALSTSSTSFSDVDLTVFLDGAAVASLTGAQSLHGYVQKTITVTSATIYYQVAARTGATLTSTVIGSSRAGLIEAVCAYL